MTKVEAVLDQFDGVGLLCLAGSVDDVGTHRSVDFRLTATVADGDEPLFLAGEMAEADTNVFIRSGVLLDGLGDDLEGAHQRSHGVRGFVLNQGFVQLDHIHRVAFLVVDSGDVRLLDGVLDFSEDGFHIVVLFIHYS